MSTEIRPRSSSSAAYLATVMLITVAAASAAWFLDSRSLAVSAGVLAFYGLHLWSVRTLLRRPKAQKERRTVLTERWAKIRERPAPVTDRWAEIRERPAQVAERWAKTRERPAPVMDRWAEIGERWAVVQRRLAETGERWAVLQRRLAETRDQRLSAAYLATVTLITVATASAAWFLDSRVLLVVSGVILAFYGLEMVRVRTLVRRRKDEKAQKEKRAMVQQRLAEIRERRALVQQRLAEIGERRALVQHRLAEIGERRLPVDPESPTAPRGGDPRNSWSVEVERLRSQLPGAGQLSGQPD